MELKAVKKLIESGIITITVGGGGIPVIQTDKGIIGTEAVIDKDLTAERLAEAIDANVLLILTDVEKAYLYYNTPKQKALDKISLKELKKHYESAQFPPGSMGPKILAAIRFLESGGKKVIVASIEKCWDALQGETGTLIGKE